MPPKPIPNLSQTYPKPIPNLSQTYPKPSPRMKAPVPPHVVLAIKPYDPNGNEKQSDRGNLLEINTVINWQRRTMSNKCATFGGAERRSSGRELLARARGWFWRPEMLANYINFRRAASSVL